MNTMDARDKNKPWKLITSFRRENSGKEDWKLLTCLDQPSIAVVSTYIPSTAALTID